MDNGNFFTGTPGKWSQQGLLAPGQQPLQNQLQNTANGAFNKAGNYYSSLLENDNDTYNSLQQPELRRFREQTIPDLSEQFAGMGSGGLSSSGFRNASVSAGADLSERLGALRAQLRQQGAQGLVDLGSRALQPTVENVYTQGQPGFLDTVANLAGTAAGAYFNPGGTAAGLASGLFNKNNQNQGQPQKGSTSPYGTPSGVNNGFDPNSIKLGQQSGGGFSHYNQSPLR